MKGANIFASELRPIVLRSLKAFAACANSLTVVARKDEDLPALNRQDANFLFCYLGAFLCARFRLSIAALPRLALRGESYLFLSKNSGHSFIALKIAVGAVWPRPHSDASIIVLPTSDKRS
jgi:hypothetical protein